MESIKFGNKNYELVANGYQVGGNGGKIILRPGTANFSDVEADLKTMQSIIILDSAGDPMLTRSDLVYAGKLSKDDNYVIGADPEQGTDITGTVMIAEFWVPDVREKVTELEAKLAYVTMMTGIDMEV